jgi:hypothetical protein
VSVNVEPAPGTLDSVSVPPSSSASLLDSERPRPVPFVLRCSGLSICVNSSNTRPRSSAGMPMPVSVTLNITWPLRAAAETRTEPCSVNLNAFEIRFLRICESFPWSVWSSPTSVSSNVSATPSPL